MNGLNVALPRPAMTWRHADIFLLLLTLAALLLLVISYHALFLGTVAGFIASALFVVSDPSQAGQGVRRSFFERTTRGLKAYLATPRLRGLLAISLSVAAAGSMIIVNTVVLVQANLGLGQSQTAWALAAFGGASMIAAFALPRLLEVAAIATPT